MYDHGWYNTFATRTVVQPHVQSISFKRRETTTVSLRIHPWVRLNVDSHIGNFVSWYYYDRFPTERCKRLNLSERSASSHPSPKSEILQRFLWHRACVLGKGRESGKEAKKFVAQSTGWLQDWIRFRRVVWWLQVSIRGCKSRTISVRYVSDE